MAAVILPRTTGCPSILSVEIIAMAWWASTIRSIETLRFSEADMLGSFWKRADGEKRSGKI